MIEIGKYNNLTVVKTLDFGIYVTDGTPDVEILMPRRYVPQGTAVGDVLRCFVYHDAEARLLATTERPLATAGEFASLRIAQTTSVGAFADWGVSKQLLIPHSEQPVAMEVGRRYIVYIYVDQKSGRLVGTARVDRYLDNVPPRYSMNDEVDALVWRRTPLGYKCIVDHRHSGMLYDSEIFRELHVGERVRAWVKGVRPDDDKIDLALQPQGYRAAIGGVEAAVLRALHLGGGFLNLTDNSAPEEIAVKLGCSKKNFKRAVGALYKQGRIALEPTGIRLTDGGGADDAE